MSGTPLDCFPLPAVKDVSRSSPAARLDHGATAASQRRSNPVALCCGSSRGSCSMADPLCRIRQTDVTVQALWGFASKSCEGARITRRGRCSPATACRPLLCPAPDRFV